MTLALGPQRQSHITGKSSKLSSRVMQSFLHGSNYARAVIHPKTSALFMTHVSFSFSRRFTKKRRDQNMKCFLPCRLAWNTLLFWQKAVILSQEIHCVKLHPPSPSDSQEFLCPLLVLLKKKSTLSARACALFACVSSQMSLCASHLSRLYLKFVGMCFMIPECQKAPAFVSCAVLAGPSEVQVSKPNVYTATKSKRTKRSWRLLPVSRPIRADSQKPVQNAFYGPQK